MKRPFLVAWILVLSAISFYASAQGETVSITPESAYTQNFDGIGTEAAVTLPDGWKIEKKTHNDGVQFGTYHDAGVQTEWRAGNGTFSKNGIYNYGAGDSILAIDRAVGGLTTGSGTDSGNGTKYVNIFLKLTNTGVTAIDRFSVKYDVEKYKKGTNGSGFLMQLYYSADGETWVSAGNAFKTLFPADDVTEGYPSAPGETVNVADTLLFSLAADESLYLAWHYSVGSGNTPNAAQALAIDNVDIEAFEPIDDGTPPEPQPQGVAVSLGETYTQDFDGIGTEAVATLPEGWRIEKQLHNDGILIGAYNAAATQTEWRGGNGLASNAKNGLYNYGAGDSITAVDRAIGGLTTGSGTDSGSGTKHWNAFLKLTNTGSEAIDHFDIEYDLEKYRQGNNTAGFFMQLYYSANGNSWTSAGENFYSLFPKDAATEGYTSAPGDLAHVSATLLQPLAAGDSLYLAWHYAVVSGNPSGAQAFGLDNVSIEAKAAETLVPTSLSIHPQNVVLLAGQPKELTILSLNNSLIDRNDQPAIFDQLTASAGKTTIWAKHTHLWQPLQYHFNETDCAEYEHTAKDTVASTAWTHIILQEQSAKPRTDPDGFLQSVRQWVQYIRANCPNPDVKIILTMNWPYKEEGVDFEKEINELLDSYKRVEQELGIGVVPVGYAYELIRVQDGVPEKDALYTDNRHPSVRATYLSACVLYAALFNDSPVGIEYKPEAIDQATATLMQIRAWEAYLAHSAVVNDFAGTINYTYTIYDQFSQPMEIGAENILWQVDGEETIAKGVFTSNGSDGTFTVTAKYSGDETIMATAGIKVRKTLDFDALNASIAAAINKKAEAEYETKYTETSRTALDVALAAAQEISGNDHVTQTEINAAKVALDVAITGLVVDNTKVIKGGIKYQLYADNTAAIIGYTADLPIDLVIPAAIDKEEAVYRVDSIAIRAFADNVQLASVALPNSVVAIGDSAFFACAALDSIVCPIAVPPICEADAFLGVAAECKVYVPSGAGATYQAADEWSDFGDNIVEDSEAIVGGIKYHLYADSTAAVIDYTGDLPAAVAFPEKVAGESGLQYRVIAVGDGAFSGATGLTSVDFGEDITTIGASAFEGCIQLAAIDVPVQIAAIGSSAFVGCTALPAFTVAAENTAYSAVNGVLFNKDKTALLAYPNAKGASYNVPDGALQIGASAFESCALTDMVVGKDVTVVHAKAFKGCATLKSVVLDNKTSTLGDSTFFACVALDSIVCFSVAPPVCGTDVFSGVATASCKVYVTVGTSSAYKADEGWSVFGNNIIEDDKLTLGGVNYQIYTNGTAKVTGYTAALPTAVTLPATVEKRGASYTVTEIGSRAFEANDVLASIVIGENITTIEASAFRNCTALVTVTIPEKTTQIATASFLGCSVLQSVAVAEDNTAYSAVDGVLFNKAKTHLLLYPNAKGASYGLPAGVAQIGVSAFEGCGVTAIYSPRTTPPVCGIGAFSGVAATCKVYVPAGRFSVYEAADGWKLLTLVADDKITKSGVRYQLNADGTAMAIGYTSDIPAQVIIPESVAGNSGMSYRVIRIGEDAFANCGAILGISLPSSIKSINKNAFSNCSKLQTADLSSADLIRIEAKAFENCGELQTVNLASTAIDIMGERAFSGCRSLTSIDLSASTIIEVGASLFYGCESLSTVFLPNSVESIGYGAFAACGSLTAITLPSALTSIGGAAFSTCGSLLSIDFSNTGVTSVSDYAFLSCAVLSTVKLSNKINSLGAGAFFDCVALSEVYAPKLTPPVCGVRVFDGVSKTACKVYVEKTSITDYKKADQWKDFFYIWPVSVDEAVVGALKAYIVDGTLMVEGAEGGMPVWVYTVSGGLVGTASIASDGSVGINLPDKGIYLVKIGDKTLKIMW